MKCYIYCPVVELQKKRVLWICNINIQYVLFQLHQIPNIKKWFIRPSKVCHAALSCKVGLLYLHINIIPSFELNGSFSSSNVYVCLRADTDEWFGGADGVRLGPLQRKFQQGSQTVINFIHLCPFAATHHCKQSRQQCQCGFPIKWHKTERKQTKAREEKRHSGPRITGPEQNWLCSDLKGAWGQTSSLTYYVSKRKTTSQNANVGLWHLLLSLFTF